MSKTVKEIISGVDTLHKLNILDEADNDSYNAEEENKCVSELTLESVVKTLRYYGNAAVPKTLYGLTHKQFTDMILDTYGLCITFMTHVKFEHVYLIQICPDI